LPETIAFSTSTQIYFYVAALLVSTTAVGGLSAALVLMNALNILLIGVMNYAVPEARRRLIENDYDSWRSWLWRIGLLLVGAALTFGVALSLLAKPLLTLIYSPAYAAFAYLIPILAVQSVLSACNTVLLAAFRTAGMPQVGFAAQTGSALVSLLLVYPLVHAFGVTGAAVGLVLTQAVWTIVYAIYIARGTLKTALATSAGSIKISS
jgi:O-antigen/teichoic acid export membrane protein